MDDIFEELYYQFVYLPKRTPVPSAPPVGNPSSTVLPWTWSTPRTDWSTTPPSRAFRRGSVWGSVWDWPSLLLKICNCEGHQLLLAGLLQGGHPVGLAGHRPLKYVAHVPGVPKFSSRSS